MTLISSFGRYAGMSSASATSGEHCHCDAAEYDNLTDTALKSPSGSAAEMCDLMEKRPVPVLRDIRRRGRCSVRRLTPRQTGSGRIVSSVVDGDAESWWGFADSDSGRRIGSDSGSGSDTKYKMNKTDSNDVID